MQVSTGLLRLFATAVVAISTSFCAAQVHVRFLATPPVTDGVLDQSIESLPVNQLPVVFTDDGRPPSPEKPTYRIAYGTGFLYLYIEVNNGTVVDRDRAYQNGDGFHLAITRPHPDNSPADEFYVLGFSASPEAANSWRKKFVWYRNIDLAFTRLTAAELGTHTEAGKTGIELLLPWSEIYPFHPWLTDAIGFNLCYVKASGETTRTYHLVLKDDNLQSEQSPRLYTRLEFEKPELTDGTQAYAILERNHIQTGDSLKAKVATLAAANSKFTVRGRVLTGEGTAVTYAEDTFDVAAGLTRQDVTVPTSKLPSGGYTVVWSSMLQNGPIPQGLSIVSKYDLTNLQSRLGRAKNRILPGSFTTLQFQLQEIERSAAKLKPYDTAATLRMAIGDFTDVLEAAEHGTDAIAVRTEIQRRAYRSQVDGTLQPYSVKIPEQLTPGKRYPLFVFLHGSGEDDRDQLRRSFFPEDAILLAPNGRGTSNAYSADHAQDDIREALEDVLANYPVDKNKIVLAGFSMGGYGVYRTFHEDPSRYRALAVFSGSPNLTQEYGKELPDFLDSKLLGNFRGVPIFLFHGGRDRNCPIELTRELVAKLQTAGANVDFHYEADKGHDLPSVETLQSFRTWFSKVTSDR